MEPDQKNLLRDYSVKVSYNEEVDFTYWSRKERVLWTAALLAGCTMLFSARTVMPLCIVVIGEELHWDRQQAGTVLSTFFWGYATTQLIGGHFADKIGGDRVLIMSCVGWATLTLSTPVLPYLVTDPTLVLFAMTLLRIAIGVCQGVHYPAITSLLSRNVHIKQRSFTFCAVATGSNMGILFSGSVGSLVNHFYGWRAAFALIGLIGVVWGLFVYFYLSSMQQLRRALALKKKGDRHEDRPGVPWRLVLSSPAFWSCIIGHMCETNCFFILMSWLPTYFHDKFPDAKSWVFNVVPWIVGIPASFFSGWLADKLIAKGMSVTKVRKLMETFALVGASVPLLIISNTEVYELAVCCLAISVGFLAFHHAGILINPQDIAPRHAGSVFGIMNMCGSIPGFVGVYTVGYILEHTKKWSHVFLLNAVVTMFGWTVFMIFGTGEAIA